MKYVSDNYDLKEIRLVSIEMQNFKNIEYGKVDFCNTNINCIRNNEPSVTGLYGQNGSGKTSVLLALKLFQDIVSGKNLAIDKHGHCIMVGKEKCSLKYEFKMFYYKTKTINQKYFESYYSYSFDIQSHDGVLTINNEEIKRRDCCGEENKSVLRTILASGDVFNPKDRTLVRCWKKAYTNLWKETADIARNIKSNAFKYGGSTLFTEYSLNQFTGLAKRVLSSDLDKKISTEFTFTMPDCLDIGKTVWAYRFPELHEKYLKEIDSCIDCIDSYESCDKTKMVVCPEEDKDNDHDYEHISESLSSIWKQMDEFCMTQGQTDVTSDLYNLYSDFFTINHSIFIVNTSQIADSISAEKLPIFLNNQSYIPFSIFSPGESEIKKFSLRKNACVKSDYPDLYHAFIGIEGINRLLQTIVPKLKIEMVLTNENQNNKLNEYIEKVKKYDFEDKLLQVEDWSEKESIEYTIYSKRDGVRIPLQYESDGVKRLIALTGLLIIVYNCRDAIVAVDELDATIFEYVLGEIVSILADSSKGQFIFTSHNMRPLEVLKPKNVFFTTTNPDKRFIKLTTLSGNNNLRDCYYRNIILGGEQPLYEHTDRFEIEMAFQSPLRVYPEDDSKEEE